MTAGAVVEYALMVLASAAPWDPALLVSVGVAAASDLASNDVLTAGPAGTDTTATRSPLGFVLATVAVLLAYGVAAWARKSFNVLVITQGVHARASLSNLQLLFFTLAVLWVVVAFLTWTGGLAELSGDVVVLLGIGATGTAGGKVAAVAKGRLDFENWAWLIRKRWIKESIQRGPNDRKPEFGDLLRTGGDFDISKFQLFAFSLVVGSALVYFAAHGADVTKLAEFQIPGAYLSLIGLSQVTYIGGKAVGPNTVGELNRKLAEVRHLESDFIKAVETEWSRREPAADRSLDAARAAKPESYRAYRIAAEEAATMVSERTGNVVADASIEPNIPQPPRAA